MKENALDKLLNDMRRLVVHADGGDVAFRPHIYVHELEHAINEERKKHFNHERFNNLYTALDTFRLETGIDVFADGFASKFIYWLFDKIPDMKQSPSSEEIKPRVAILDMERLRPDVYLTDEQKQAMRDALRMPSLAEWIKKSPNEKICAFLKKKASDFRRDSMPPIRNVQSIDGDQLAELFDALAEKFSQNQEN